MIALRIAALVCALLTITLNAHHGYTSAEHIGYAVLLAALYAALDLAKCAAIPAAVSLWRARHRLAALASVALFALLFANSAWNAVTQVTIVRSSAKANTVADSQTRTRTEAIYKRLTAELTTAQQSPTFTATAACTLPKSNDARSFCANVATLKANLATAERALATTKPMDATPQNTLVAAYFPNLPASTVTFALAVVPILLAEIVGSFGFALATLATASLKPPRTRLGRFRLLFAGQGAEVAKNDSTAVSVASGVGPPPPPSATPTASSPRIIWSTSQ